MPSKDYFTRIKTKRKKDNCILYRERENFFSIKENTKNTVNRKQNKIINIYASIANGRIIYRIRYCFRWS